MKNNLYYIVEVFWSDQLEKEKLLKKVDFIHKFSPSGIEEFSMDESEVDQVLGQKALCGGDISLDLVTEIENFNQNHSKFVEKYYFDGEHSKINSIDFSSFMAANNVKYELKEFATEDWNKNWQESFQPVNVEDFFWVVPDWHDCDDLKRPYFKMTPAMAFGTGHHETTYLCLSFLKGMDLKQKSVLDFGAGSGILGISAGILGAKSGDFYDIDEKARDNFHQNRELNISKLEDFKSSYYINHEIVKIEDKAYDIVFANILWPILEENCEQLISRMKKDGFLILSGLLKEQINQCEEKYLDNTNLKLIDKMVKGDWACLVFKK